MISRITAQFYLSGENRLGSLQQARGTPKFILVYLEYSGARVQAEQWINMSIFRRFHDEVVETAMVWREFRKAPFFLTAEMERRRKNGER